MQKQKNITRSNKQTHYFPPNKNQTPIIAMTQNKKTNITQQNNIVPNKHDPQQIESNPNPTTKIGSNPTNSTKKHVFFQPNTTLYKQITFLNLFTSRTFTKDLREFPLQRNRWTRRSCCNNIITTVHFSTKSTVTKDSSESINSVTASKIGFWVFTRS